MITVHCTYYLLYLKLYEVIAITLCTQDRLVLLGKHDTSVRGNCRQKYKINTFRCSSLNNIKYVL